MVCSLLSNFIYTKWKQESGHLATEQSLVIAITKQHTEFLLSFLLLQALMDEKIVNDLFSLLKMRSFQKNQKMRW